MVTSAPAPTATLSPTPTPSGASMRRSSPFSNFTRVIGAFLAVSWMTSVYYSIDGLVADGPDVLQVLP